MRVTRVFLVAFGVVSIACSTGEAPSDLQYDPAVRAALIEVGQSECGRYFAVLPPSYLDEPSIAPPSLDGSWTLSPCASIRPGSDWANGCDSVLTFSRQGDGRIFTPEGIAYLIGMRIGGIGADGKANAMILQRVHVVKPTCEEEHIRQIFLAPSAVVEPCNNFFAACIPHNAIIFDVLVGGTCPAPPWTCQVATLQPQ
jgi:hypothetical protein